MPSRTALAAVLVAVATATATAQTSIPGPGWKATLSTGSYDVSGVVTVIDDDTLLIDDFSYNGGGASVYFYLAQIDTVPAFAAGLEIGPQLFGTVFDDDELVIDLPPGESIDGWRAVSVWCDAFGVSFGDATFAPPAGLPGDYNGDGVVDAADYTVWRDSEGQSVDRGTGADGDGNGVVNSLDFDLWAATYGSAAPAIAVPEPGAAAIALVGGLLAACRRRA